jgi:CRISPR/Cas system CMR-associated protein Cmr3 (group 5 of RAMP superfamily)
MQTIQIKISNTDFQKYNLESTEIKFTDLVDLISREYARKALLECNKIVKQEGLSEMTMDEINAEINAVRDAKNHS